MVKTIAYANVTLVECLLQFKLLKIQEDIVHLLLASRAECSDVT